MGILMTGATAATFPDFGGLSPRYTLLISGALVTSPLWLEGLRQLSEFAAAAAPVVGCIVGLVTLYKTLRKGAGGHKHKRKFLDTITDAAREVNAKPGARAGLLLVVLAAVAALAHFMPGKRSDMTPLALLSAQPVSSSRRKSKDDAGEDGEADAPDDPGAPSWYKLAVALKGTHEGTKKKPNKIVQSMFADAGHSEIKDTTATPWCAVFVSSCLVRNGYAPLPSMMARSGLQYGEALGRPHLGCIVVMWRGSRESSSGHIGLYAGEDATHVFVLGGNQSDAVTVAKFPKSRVLPNGYRWPRKVSQLRTVKNAATAAAASAGSALSAAVVVAESLKPVQQPLIEVGTPTALSFAARIAMLCAVIACVAAIRAALRRIRDHKERGV